MRAFVARCSLHVSRMTLLVAIVVFSSCAKKDPVSTKTFADVDSLISAQIKSLPGNTLKKSVEIGGKKDEISFKPDSLQWSNELDIFRQLDQVNKASFLDAYVVSDIRDTNSNLTIREIKANRLVPVSLIRFYFLRTPKDLRKIEAAWTEENALYKNDRTMVLELNERHLVSHYRIEGTQKMVMSDSVKFLITGEVLE
ncbi:MAG: hypothetical protein WDO14_10560 [Bacteroidota bacterium]